MNRRLEPPVFPVLTSIKFNPLKSEVNSSQLKSFGLLLRRLINFSLRVIILFFYLRL